MSSSTDSIEVSAASVDEAVGQALDQLQAQHDDVTIEVLSTARSGLLGLGARPARVRVTRRIPDGASSGVMSPPPAPPPKPRTSQPRGAGATARVNSPAPPPPPAASMRTPSQPAFSPLPAAERPAARPMLAEEEEHVEELAEQLAPQEGPEAAIDIRAQVAEGAGILVQILELMGEKAEVETVCDDDPEMLELNIKADGSGLLIGRHGQTLDALEYILNRIIARRMHEAAPISVDTESYRARRRGQLHRMALAKGEEAKREHQAVTLEPMPPRDRRIVHLALKDDPLLTTHSSGEGFLRAVQIVPVDAREGAGQAGRERRRGVGGRGRSDNPPGQQGGFQHGQKRIV